MNHVMIDLETWGTAPGAAIRSIGACLFDPRSGVVGPTYYANIDDLSCTAAGLDMDMDTVQWWNRQDGEAQARLTRHQRPLADVAHEFYSWFTDAGAEFVWAHGASFDPVLWEAACRAVGVKVPWRFYNIRDTRTLYALADLALGDFPRQGVHHDALDDCRHQVLAVYEVHKRIGGRF